MHLHILGRAGLVFSYSFRLEICGLAATWKAEDTLVDVGEASCSVAVLTIVTVSIPRLTFWALSILTVLRVARECQSVPQSRKKCSTSWAVFPAEWRPVLLSGAFLLESCSVPIAVGTCARRGFTAFALDIRNTRPPLSELVKCFPSCHQ